MALEQNNQIASETKGYRSGQRTLLGLSPRTVLIISTLALGHFIAYVLLIMFSHGATMNSFDSGAELSIGAKFSSLVVDILSFPLVSLVMYLPIRNTGVWGWLIAMLNSLMWGTAIWICLKWLRNRTVASLPNG